MADSAVARLRGILARDMTANAIDQLLGEVQAEMGGTHVLGDDGRTCTTGAEQLRAALREVRSDLVKLYASLPDGLDFYLGRIRITRLRIDAALAEQPIPYTLAEAAEKLRTTPGRPTPKLVRDLLEGAAAQSPRCGESTRLRNGTTVSCTKQDQHPSPWHRRGAHSWKVVFGDPHTPAPDKAAGEPPRSAVDIMHTALRAIRSASRKCACGSNALAHTAITETSTPRRTRT